MGYTSSIFSLGLIAFIGLLFSWANDPTGDPVERHVFATSAYSLGGATLLNGLCALAASQYGLVEPVGSETEACMPYTFTAGIVIARVHMWHTGGYKNGEWAYVQKAASRPYQLVEDAICKAMGNC